MYELAKKSREALKNKARRLAGEKDQKVDSSTFTPAEPLNADIKTGMRPISRRAYKTGGKVEGEACAPRMDRKPRKSGGKAMEEKAEAKEYTKAKINRDVKAANEEREGIKHIGGLKTGGRAKKQTGGKAVSDSLPPRTAAERLQDKLGTGPKSTYTEDSGQSKSAAERAEMNKLAEEAAKGRKYGGKAHKAGGGYVPHETKAGKPTIPGMKKGGRTERKDGGRVAKGKTNINIVIQAGPKSPQDGPGSMMPPRAPVAPPPAMSPAGGPPMGGAMPPPGMPPMAGGAPMMRKAGGRVYRSYKDMDAGAGSGEGRLEKVEIQKSKRNR